MKDTWCEMQVPRPCNSINYRLYPSIMRSTFHAQLKQMWHVVADGFVRILYRVIIRVRQCTPNANPSCEHLHKDLQVRSWQKPRAHQKEKKEKVFFLIFFSLFREDLNGDWLFFFFVASCWFWEEKSSSTLLCCASSMLKAKHSSQNNMSHWFAGGRHLRGKNIIWIFLFLRMKNYHFSKIWILSPHIS